MKEEKITPKNVREGMVTLQDFKEKILGPVGTDRRDRYEEELKRP